MSERNLPDFRETNREAGKILSQRSNRLKLVEGFLFCGIAFIFAFLLQQGCLQIAALQKEVDWVFILSVCLANVLFWGFQLLVTAPLLVGMLQMAVRMANDEDAFLPELFSPFSSGKAYFRVLVILWPFYWKMGLFWLLPGLAFDGLTALFGASALLSILKTVVSFLLVVAWILLALRGFLRLSFLLQWRMPLPASGRANREIAGRSFAGGGIWWIHYLPRIILGFLTVGILLIADVIPRMMISYFRYAGRMTDYPFSSEEPKHE